VAESSRAAIFPWPSRGGWRLAPGGQVFRTGLFVSVSGSNSRRDGGLGGGEGPGLIALLNWETGGPVGLEGALAYPVPGAGGGGGLHWNRAGRGASITRGLGGGIFSQPGGPGGARGGAGRFSGNGGKFLGTQKIGLRVVGGGGRGGLQLTKTGGHVGFRTVHFEGGGRENVSFFPKGGEKSGFMGGAGWLGAKG